VRYRSLGGTGIQVSELCLGTMMLGQGGNPDRGECVRMVHTALDAGVNFIDTADVYSGKESEDILGEALSSGRRDGVVLATKFYWPTGPDLNQRGGSRRHVIEAVEGSLRRLRTDWIDLYQMHRPDPATDLGETLSALTDLVHQGKVRAIGCSTFPAHLIAEAQWISSARGLARLRSEQPPYSIFVRGVEREVLPACARYGMGVLVYAPLNAGWLTGKYRRDAEPDAGTRAARRWNNPRRWDRERDTVQRKFDLVDQLSALAADAGLPLTHLATAFTLEHPAVSSSIMGPRTSAQLEDVLAGADVRLSADVLDRIDELCPPGTIVDGADVNTTLTTLTDVAQRRRSA
jgi:aryl-alcohol dehydrogenase-like predicted oxidoreductase